MNSIATVDRDIRSLRDSYDQIKRARGNSKGLRSFLGRYPPPPSELEKMEPPRETERDEESVDADVKAEDVADKSFEEIKADEEQVRKLDELNSPEKVGLEARKRLTLELFKSGREGLKSLLLDSYIRELPILGPLHDILAAALDKSAKDLIDRKADAIASSMPTERNALDNSLSDAAREVSRSVNLEVPLVLWPGTIDRLRNGAPRRKASRASRQGRRWRLSARRHQRCARRSKVRRSSIGSRRERGPLRCRTTATGWKHSGEAWTRDGS